MATKDGKIVDEINGLIASRDSIRTTMLDASVAGVTNTSKLADLATKLTAAKLGATTYNVSKTDQAIIPAGKLTTGAQTIRAVTTSGIDAANIKSGAVVKVGDEADAARIITVEGTFTNEATNPITAATVLSGKIGYVNGAKVTGNIPTVTPSTTDPLICGAKATIAKGYLASDVTITAKDLASQTSGTAAAEDIRLNKTAWVGGKQVTGSMPNATITSGSATITSANYTYDNGSFKVTGSADVSAPTVGTAGYISSSVGTLNINKNKATLSATVAKIAGSTSITGTTAMTPTISRQSLDISGVTDAAADNATTTAPTSSSTYKAWVKVNSAAKNVTLTATPSVSTAGYGTKDYHGIGGASATVNLSSADIYIPIKNGDVSVANLGTLTKQPSISKQSFTNISGITDAAADNATTTAPTSSSTYKAWVKVKSAANTASYTPTATKTEGYILGGSVAGPEKTYGASASADTYIPIKNGAYSVSVSATAGSASMSATGVPTTTSTTDCYITLSTTAGSVTGTATIETAGWIDKDSKSSSPTSVSVSGNETKLYLAINHYYTSANLPSSSDGNNGDVWMVTA